MPLATGSVLGDRYRITRSITFGSMGAVYEADDLQGGPPCAVKQLLDHDLEEPTLSLVRRKFAEEVRFLSSLDHPAIPRMRDYLVADGRSFLIMDLVDGPTLEDEIPLPPEQAADAMLEVLDVLVYLHNLPAAVLHRDVKPPNLIRSRADGRVKLIDFGIARLYEAANTRTQTQLGSVAYAPLEQIQGHPEPRSDVYAVGATLYHLVVGKQPKALDVKPLQRVLPDVDRGLAAIVNRACAQRPSDRFPSAAAMREALLDWRRGEAPPAPASWWDRVRKSLGGSRS